MLLAVVILLALVAVLMLGLSRRSAARANEALAARTELQRKWGAATARATVLPRSAKILAAENRARREQRDPAVSAVRADLELGDQRLTLVVSDEQAKANVNTLWRELGDERAARAVRALLPSDVPGSSVDLVPDPRAPRPEPKRRGERREGDAAGEAVDGPTPPTADGDAASEGEPNAETPDAPSGPIAFGSWGQVFRQATPTRLFGDDWDDEDELPEAAASELTCWGDGRLRLSYASPKAIEAVLTGELAQGQIRRILSNRTDKPEGPADAWLAGAELADEQRQAVMKLLAPRSRCHSLLIVGDDGWRLWHELAVREVWSEGRRPPAPQGVVGGDTAAEGRDGGTPAVADDRPAEPPKDRMYRFAW